MIISGVVVSHVGNKRLPSGTVRTEFVLEEKGKRITCIAWKELAEELFSKVKKGEKFSFKGFMDDKKEEFVIQEELSANTYTSSNLRAYLYKHYDEGRLGYRQAREKRIEEMRAKGFSPCYICEIQDGIWACDWVPTKTKHMYVDSRGVLK